MKSFHLWTIIGQSCGSEKVCRDCLSSAVGHSLSTEQGNWEMIVGMTLSKYDVFSKGSNELGVVGMLSILLTFDVNVIACFRCGFVGAEKF